MDSLRRSPLSPEAGDVTVLTIRTTRYLLTAVLFALASPTLAQSVWFVDDDAALGGDGAAWDTAFKFLQDALHIGSAGDEIRVAQGVYRPDQDETGMVTPGDRRATFSLVNGVTLTGGYRGCPSGDCGASDPADRNVKQYTSLLSGDLAGNDGPMLLGDFVRCYSGQWVDVASGCELSDLDTDGDVDQVDHTLFLAGNNYGENSYHVITATEVDETAVVDGFLISGGNANGPAFDNGDVGAGLYIYHTLATVKPRFAQCTFSENSATGYGGGVYNDKSVRPRFSNCGFIHNFASYGGGVYTYHHGGSQFLDCRFERNAADYGGGLGNYGGSPNPPSLIACIFDANRAANYGGGVYNVGSSWGNQLSMVGCVLVGNCAYHPYLGGGGGMYNGSNGDPLIANCSVVGNQARAAGGGVCNDNNALTNMTNCILHANHALRGPQIALVGSSTATIAFSDVQGGEAMVYVAGQDGLTWGDGNRDIDPLLTTDSHLQAGSPFIDAGNNGQVPSDATDWNTNGNTTEPIPFDMDGEARFGDDPTTPDTGVGIPPIVDLGADEFGDTDGDGLPDCWESQYFGSATAADPDEDTDGDGVANRQEFGAYGSDPTAAPVFVCNACDPAPDGSYTHPYGSIQEAIDAASDGGTVLVLALTDTTYSGPGNVDLDFSGKSLVVRRCDVAEICDDSGVATIDCDAVGRAVNPASLRGAVAVIEGFTITGSAANADARIRIEESLVTLKNSVLEIANPTAEAGAFRSAFASPSIDNVTLAAPVTPVETIGLVAASNVRLDGELKVSDGILEVQSSWLYGPGQVNLADGAALSVSAQGAGDTPSVFRSDIRGLGDIQIALGQALYIEQGAVVDLGGGTGGGCADPASSEDWGTVFVDGTLLVRDATIQNTNIEVSLADFDGAVGVINNNITLLEASDEYGGEFFVEGAAFIRCNHITSYGDRYLDLDPDPSIPPEARPTIEENRIGVIITQGVGNERGEILELRGTDYDCGTDGVNPDCNSGAHHAPGSAGFTADPSANWVLESLEIEPGAKLNLTNRQGFVYQDPGISTPETVYVRDLILRADATLNTALQTLYYETLTLETAADIIDVPLLGFSLKIIEFENDTEFDVRIRTRVRDPADSQPAEPPYLEGSITREEGLDANQPDNGVMLMRTQAVGQPSATSVAAKGAFARAGDEEIVVAFEYQFEQNPDAELIVYLSDDPDVSESLVELARISPPAYGPGSIGSDAWALFYGTFPRGELNFTRGTYVELELRGQEAIVWIDNFDPQIRCPSQCGDFAPPDGLDTEDFLVLLGEYGRSLDPFAEDAAKWCLDSNISFDQYVDLSDVFLWDAFMNGDDLNACGTGSGGGSPAAGPPRAGTPVALPALTSLVLAGKSERTADQRDYLYTIRPNGVQVGEALDPASAPDPEAGFRSNMRLIQDSDGRVYQLHGTQGLIRLDTAQVVIPPSTFTVGTDEVHVGVTSIGTDDFTGLPLLDVAFHPADPGIAYVVPVLVVPEDTNPDAAICPYKAAAKLSLTEQPGGEYAVDLLKVYGTNPAEDGCVNVTPVLGCEFILREPDVQRVREIEIDATGQNVLVLSAQGLADNNDWLLVFDETTGDETRISAGGLFPGPTAETCPAVTSGGVPLPPSPTALTLSACGDQLYLTSSLANADPQDACAQVSIFDLQRSGDQITGLTLNRTIDIDANTITGPDYGWGHIATVTALAEDPSTCSLFVTGFTAPRVDPYLSTDDPLYQQLFGNSASIFTTPTLAIVPTGQTTATATELQCHDLALPISAVLSIHEPGDCNGDDQVDLDDYAGLYNCLTGPTGELTFGCECFDLDTDGQVDLVDFGQLQLLWTAP